METTEAITKKIIVIDDSVHSDFIERDVKEYLLPMKPLILRGYTYNQGMELYREHLDVDVMIIDISIDRAKGGTEISNSRLGLELIINIRKENSKVCLIAYTTYNDDELKKKLKELSVHFINKYYLSDPTQELLDQVYKCIMGV